MITHDLRATSPRDSYRILTSLVIPRAIAWISTLQSNGAVNLAPFSSFMGIFGPPMVAVTLGRRKDGSLKDTHRNLRERQEAVVHIPDRPLLEAMHACGEELPADESEADRLGLEMVPSTLVAPPIIKRAKVSLECRLNREVELSPSSTLVLLDVLLVHAQEEIWNQSLDCADAGLWEPVARLASVAGPNYAGLGERLELPPPKLPTA